MRPEWCVDICHGLHTSALENRVCFQWDIKAEVKRFCAEVPRLHENTCKYLESKLDEVIDFLDKGLVTVDVCKKLGMCDAAEITNANLRTITNLKVCRCTKMVTNRA